MREDKPITSSMALFEGVTAKILKTKNRDTTCFADLSHR